MSSARRNPPAPACVNQWPINTFWQTSDERVSQHWYISFCLMMSALQDNLTGCVLQEKKNLNWATICYYYSLVHTARLLTFCVVGDYPRLHKPLKELYKAANMASYWKADPEDNRESEAGSVGPIRFNWLCDFSGWQTTDVDPSDFRMGTDELLARLTRTHDRKLKSLSSDVNRLGLLRNYANYESLLIAHEKHPVLVTELFERLAKLAKSASSNDTALAIATYKSYIQRSPLLENRRLAFKAISNQYVAGRLYTCLEEKVKCSKRSMKRLNSFHRSLRFRISGSIEQQGQTEQIEREIKMQQFEPKTSQMNRFQKKIENFEHRDYEQ
ncbi:hypothetical protein ACFL3Q_09310 [Planctomycetota bacterium]